jgi:hypothetical protein
MMVAAEAGSMDDKSHCGEEIALPYRGQIESDLLLVCLRPVERAAVLRRLSRRDQFSSEAL